MSALRTAAFLDTIGINTHIDFGKWTTYGYENLPTVEASINYLGLKNLRDSAQSGSSWQQVAKATGAKFDAFINSTSPAGMVNDLRYISGLAKLGILNFLEGGNEEDGAYATSQGNNIYITKDFQKQVYATGHALGLPVINMSFGAGWTAANNWQGNYDKVGDLSAYTDYANAHSYPVTGQTVDATMDRHIDLAHLAAASRPVITTEIGWNENDGYTQANIAKYSLDATMDGVKNGDVKIYFYALYDDGSGKFGLMNKNGTPKPAGTAIHNLTTLLADTGTAATTFATGTLSYTLTGTTAHDNSLLMEKSDGSYWVSLWNESDAAHNVKLSLGNAAEIKVFDPLTGLTAIQDVKNATSATIAMKDHPILVEVMGGGGSPPPPPPPPAHPPPSTLTPNDLTIAVPASESVAAGAKVSVSGIAISDPWAAAAPGSMTLKVWDSGGGTVAMAGHTATSSGRISVTGTLAQLNADLAGLTYTAGASKGSDTITVDVLNQNGVEVKKTIGVTVAAPPAPPTPPPAPVITGTGSDALVLSMSEDAYQGDARFTVAVDGKQLGGTFTTTALHSAAASQSFTFKGDWGIGAHTVTVSFLNDTWGGTPTTDRNLYVDALSYEGKATSQGTALISEGPQNFSVADNTTAPGVMSTQSAIGASSFLDTLGVNTHIDSASHGYEKLATVEAAINYLGLKNLRDSAQTASDATTWQQVAQATGARFDDYIAETSPAGMTTDLGFVKQLAQQGILNFLEGGNEEDNAKPAALGNTLAITAKFQQQVFATGDALGLPVINMSFGSGWTAANNWQGDYGNVGDLSAAADYANAHTYMLAGQGTDETIQRLNGLANLAAASRPVITTEIGWLQNQGFTPDDIARYTLDAALDGIKNGDAKSYFYGLFDDGSGKSGLMNADGTAKPAGLALHNLTTLLRDTGASAGSFAPGSLSYSLSSGDNTVLMEKSDGTYWLSVWNEAASAHSVTLTLGSAATKINVFDPLTGTSAVQTASNTGSITFTVPDHPVIVEVVDGVSSTPAGGSAGSGTGTTSGVTPDGTSGGTTAPTGTPAPNPIVSAPDSQTVAATATTAIANVSVSDPWAGNNSGSLQLNVVASAGAVAMTDASGHLLTGSGTDEIHVSGTLSQINAELATLSYTAGAANASVTVGVMDQAGAATTNVIDVKVTDPEPGTGVGTGTTSGGSNTVSTITIDPLTASVTENVSGAQIVATSGDHMFFIGGSGDVVTATGGAERIRAFQGGNTITTGASDDAIGFAGSKNVIDAGAGNNMLVDTGGDNTIVLPAAGQGHDDIFGPVLTNGDRFDLRPLLAGTSWKGDFASIGSFVNMTTTASGTVINVDPSGLAGGASHAVAKMEGPSAVSLDMLLAHSITS